ncbi:MAG TPA: rhomboid family intramembrane serine protease [Xanthomonadaceae bacterium]|nr:rhomboid family intramembrane serine protease [Xanthomonadaceae bacterium]
MYGPLPPVVRILLIANFAVYFLQVTVGDVLIAHFALWPLGEPPVELVRRGFPPDVGFAPWQLLTYGFMHGNPPHLLINMFALFMFGSELERFWGGRPFAIYFLVCVIGAGLVQLVVATLAVEQGQFYPTVGASGGVFGILLGYAMMFPRRRVMLLFPPIPMPAWLLVTLFGALELYLGVSGTRSGIAHFAHLGGMVFGFLVIQYWRGRLPIKPKRQLMR